MDCCGLIHFPHKFMYRRPNAQGGPIPYWDMETLGGGDGVRLDHEGGTS